MTKKKKKLGCLKLPMTKNFMHYASVAVSSSQIHVLTLQQPSLLSGQDLIVRKIGSYEVTNYTLIETHAWLLTSSSQCRCHQ